MDVASGATLHLKSLTVADGLHIFGIGGITNFGTLSIANSTIARNSGFFGGGISNGGELTISKSTFSSNSASEGRSITNFGTLNVSNSTFSGNGADGGGG